MLSAWRPVEDAVASLVCHGALSRFPKLKIAIVENGSSWVEPLLKSMADIYKKMPQDFPENPVEVVKRNIHVSPFWEEDLGALGRAARRSTRCSSAPTTRTPRASPSRPATSTSSRGLPEEACRQDHGRQPRHADEHPRGGRSMTGAGGGLASIPALTAGAADRFGDHPAVVDGDLRLSYAELDDRAATFAAALVASGVERGDRVALWAPNSAEWIVAVLGLFQAGAVLVPVNTRFKGTEAADLLTRSHARVLVTVTDFLDTDYLAMLDGVGGRRWPTSGPSWSPEARPRPARSAGRPSWAGPTDAARATVAERRAALGPDDPSDILFTSGTTGVPKGVVMTHGRTLGVAADWVAMTGLQADDRYLMVNPYFHMFGLKAGILACVIAGATMLPEPVFEVDRVLARVAAEAVTVLPGAPTIYQAMLDHPGRDGHDLSSLRIAVTGAADIPVELIRRVDAELPFSFIVTGYGLTEAGTASATAPDDDAETVATTVGRPRPGFELRITDDQGRRPPRRGGRRDRAPRPHASWRGTSTTREATAEALSPDGWLRTGDLGVVDDRGCLRIVGRAKDMFIVGGFNAYPAEIENALLRHPDIAQAAVIGIPDERLGEVGMAFVVPRDGAEVTPEAVIAWSRDQMANYKVPRAVELIDELPLNATGKVEKNVLRARVS